MATPASTPSQKAKVKLELQDINIPTKLTEGDAITTAMLAAPEFSSLSTEINAARAATDLLREAKRQKDLAEEAAQSATATQDHRENTYDEAFTILAGRVDEIARGDKAIIDKAAMKSYYPGKAAPIGELPQVKNLSLTQGDNAGELDAQWDKIKGAKTYVIESAQENPASWKSAGVSTKTSHTLKGFDSGKKIWVRVAAVGSAGQGPWSEPAVKFTP